MNPTTNAEPHLLVVLGASGDLTHRKILPALHRLFTDDKLGDGSVVLGAALPSDVDDASFRASARQSLQVAEDDAFCSQRLFYQTLHGGEPQDYQALTARIIALELEHKLPGKPHLLPGVAAPGF